MTEQQPIAIHWFRQDLRLHDNPSLFHAAKTFPVLCIYILEDEDAGNDCMGAASRWWLHHSLAALNTSLEGKLALFRGKAEDTLNKLCEQYHIAHISWNRCYEPWRVQRDTHLKHVFKSRGIDVHSYNGAMLWEPCAITKANGEPYRIFTPFFRKGCLEAEPPAKPLAVPERLRLISPPTHSQTLESLALLPTIRWDRQLEPHWQIGEQGALQRFRAFLETGLKGYKEGRNLPAKPHVSRLSPHLHFGEISVRHIWHQVQLHQHRFSEKDRDSFLTELGWREFSTNLLLHHPQIASQNLQSRFDAFAWQHDESLLRAWQKGQTGYPIIDAGMRELWQTGYMHNRVRMIVGSFLVKNLLLDWRHGERWFWDCLVDADHANNAASWQWVAGCGADAAPYFRIFNPVTQGEKFDNTGEYTRRFVPELRDIPEKYLFCPWEAPPMILKAAGIELGKTYPKPVVDIKTSRERALAAFHALKK